MGSHPPKDDSYFASIKSVLRAFVWLNIVTVVLGAAVVNIANLLRPPTSTEIIKPAAVSHVQPAEATATAPRLDTPPSAAAPQENIPPLPKFEDETAPSGQVREPESILNTGGQSPPETESDEGLIEKRKRSERRRLILPTINITTTVVDIPIVAGNWDISTLGENAGMLEGFATRPEESGVLVIAAHVTTDWPIGGPFAELNQMDLGDPVIFQMGDTEYVYEISRFLRVDTSNVKVLHKGGEDGIVLVTCDSYSLFSGRYSSRFVAYGNLRETRTAAPDSD